MWKLKRNEFGIDLTSTLTNWTASLRPNRVLSLCPPDDVSLGKSCCLWRVSEVELDDLIDLLWTVRLIWLKEGG